MNRQYRNVYLRCSDCHTCSRCRKEKHSNLFVDNSRCCIACSPLHCDVCEKDVPRTAFPSNQLQGMNRQHRNFYLRCSHCHTCSRCQKEKHIKAFQDNGRSCIECEKQARPFPKRSVPQEHAHTPMGRRSGKVVCVCVD